MELKEIASVAGKGGLFKILKPTRNGVILESLDEQRTKFMAGPTAKVSILEEISIYTTSEEGTMPLAEVLKLVNQHFPDGTGINPKSEGADLRAFMEKVLPNYDTDKVYNSDIKKLVVWFEILRQYAPSLLHDASKEETKSEVVEPKSEIEAPEAESKADSKAAKPTKSAKPKKEK